MDIADIKEAFGLVPEN